MEYKKYLTRFAPMMLIALGALLFTQGANALKVIGYKAGLLAMAVCFAEVVWISFFKPVFGSSEKLKSGYKTMGIFVFRGILYGAIILAFTLGL